MKLTYNKETATTQCTLRGVTLIELLVALAIIGVLTAIIAPVYINSADSARRTKCAYQLRQIGDSVLAYEFEYGVLPGPVDLLEEGGGSIEKYLMEAGYLINEEMWVCPSNENFKSLPNKDVARRSSYTINNSESTLPSYFFGAPEKPRALSLSVIKASYHEGIWLLRDGDIPAKSSSFDPVSSPGIGSNRPPHAKGRNYFFIDGHIQHYKMGAFPDHGKGESNNDGGGGMDPVLMNRS